MRDGKLEFKREIYIFENHFEEFYKKQPGDIKEKIYWILRIIESHKIIGSQYLKLVLDGLFEIRISKGRVEIRVFCLIDTGNRLILLNSFQKKSQKIPKDELKKAKELQKKYRSKGERRFNALGKIF